jgi:hypothetical protein
MNYAAVNRVWQSATLFLAPLLIVLLIWFKPEMDLYQWLLCLHLPLLMLHESEEYVLAPLSFKEFFNLKSPFGSKTDPDFPLDDAYVFQVNIVIAYPVVILGALLATVAPWIGFSMIWFELILNTAAALRHDHAARGGGVLYPSRLGALAHHRGRGVRRARHEDPRTTHQAQGVVGAGHGRRLTHPAAPLSGLRTADKLRARRPLVRPPGLRGVGLIRLFGVPDITGPRASGRCAWRYA